jgi:hypothetical protein
MYRESKLKLSDFVYHDRFELSDYLSYLFHQFYDPVPNRSEDKMVKRI